ncbi:MAG: MATE family efflux transporter, partial [Oscillospiraceae bacterium]|nr:MATE family efflux transporter [Oscillospiraceae bacterium]
MSNEIAKDLTRGPVMKQLAAFALPVALANALQALYSMVDMVVVGQVVGSGGLSAVGIGGQMMMMYLAIGMGFSFGAQVLLSQQVGAQDQELQPTIGTLFTMELVLAIVVSVLGIVFCRPLLNLLNTPGGAMEEAVAYTIVCCAGTIFTHGYTAVCAILRGMGESKLPMIFIGVAAILNLLLDFLFVAGLHMGAAGAALATIVSQAVSFLSALVYL